jgi:hypothetical protein
MSPSPLRCVTTSCTRPHSLPHTSFTFALLVHFRSFFSVHMHNREGELNGASGTFPASYVVSLSEVKKEFTAPEDTAAACGVPPPQPTPTTTPAPVPAAATAAAASIPRSSSPRSALSNHKRRKKKSLSWGLDRNSQDFTFAKSECVACLCALFALLWGEGGTSQTRMPVLASFFALACPRPSCRR